jgi:hypothetical protein
MSRRISRGTSRVAVALFAAAALASMSAGAALAGEETAQGASWCRFSGQNDDPNAAPPEHGRVQSYGQLVRQGLKATEPSPGIACNPQRTFLPPLK